MANQKVKPLAAAVGAAFLASAALAPLASASDNPFQAVQLNSGYQVAGEHGEGKCGEGRCGEDKKAKKHKEGKCGEGRCGEDKKAKKDKKDKEDKEDKDRSGGY